MITPSPWECLILTLAAGQVVDTWRNASLFESWRADVEARSGAFHDMKVARYWWAAAMNCPYCFSHWTPWLTLVTAFALPGLALPAAQPWLMLPVYGLAMTRAGLLLDGLLPPRLRYDRGAREDSRGPWTGVVEDPIIDANPAGSWDQ